MLPLALRPLRLALAEPVALLLVLLAHLARRPCGLLALCDRLCARRGRPCNQGIMSRTAGLGIRKETRAHLAASSHQTGRLHVPLRLIGAARNN
jgi:hypothetical protein